MELKKIIFIGGKGGVGKTTISSSIASKLVSEGKKTLIISTDPAHSLGDILDMRLNNFPKKVASNLYAIELDPIFITDEHFKNVESTIRGYSNPSMFPKIKKHLELSKSSPGAQEAAILESICKLIVETSNEYDHIVFDTAPTGHTIRLLTLPSIMSAWTDGLAKHQKEQEKMKNAAKVFWRKKEDDKFNPFKPSDENRWHRATEVLNKRKALFKEASKILVNSEICQVFLVMVPEILPYEETYRTTKDLNNLDIKCSGIFINQIIPIEQKDEFWQIQVKKQQEIMQKVKKNLSKFKRYFLYLTTKDLRKFENLKDIEILENL